MKRNNEINMTEGNLFTKLIYVSIPLIFSGILQLLYNAADLIVCGSFGGKDHSVAAISSTNPLINLIINLFLGLSVGANVLMARCFGQQNKEKGQRVVYTSMIFSLIFGVLVGIFGFFTSKYFLSLMNTPQNILELSASYLKIYFIGLPFSMIYNFGASLLRAVGDSKRPFYFLAFAGVFNVILNLIFVIVCKLDVQGVALATIISQAISAILVMICLIRNKGFFHFSFKELKFYKKEAIEILKIGLPAGIQGSIFSLSNVVIQSSINSLGELVMDGNGASSSLEGFVYVTMNSVANSSVAFISANYGINKKENIKKIVIYSCLIIIAMNIITGCIVLGFQNQLIHLYVQDDLAIKAAKQRLLIIVLTYFTCGIMDTFAYALRGIGYSFTPMIVTLIGVCGIRILWIYTIFEIPQFHNISSVALSYPISWIITSCIHISMFIVLFKKTFKNKQQSLYYETAN